MKPFKIASKILPFLGWIKSMNENIGISNKETNNLKTIIEKLIQNDSIWLKEKDIKVGDKGDYWILNYGMFDKNEFNRLARGLVIQKPSANFSGDPLELIKGFPFIRFFNSTEVHADPVNVNNSEMLEKMDGCMVSVFFPNGVEHPHWNTRNMLSTHQPDLDLKTSAFDGSEHYLLSVIGQYVKSLNFNEDDTRHTYVFEFIHKASSVITKYTENQWGLYLLAARDLLTHKEELEQNLDKIAKRIGAGRPKRWDAVADSAEIESLMNQMCAEIKDFEGVVFRDKQTGKRVKLKCAEYVAKHHMLGDVSFKRLIPKVLEGEEQEIIAYFPHAKTKIEKIKQQHNKFKNKVVKTILQYQNFKNLSKKELWEKIDIVDNDRFTKNCIMRYINKNPNDLNNAIETELKKIAVVSFKKDTYSGSQTFQIASKQYLDMLNLEDEDAEEL